MKTLDHPDVAHLRAELAGEQGIAADYLRSLNDRALGDYMLLLASGPDVPRIEDTDPDEIENWLLDQWRESGSGLSFARWMIHNVENRTPYSVHARYMTSLMEMA